MINTALNVMYITITDLLMHPKCDMDLMIVLRVSCMGELVETEPL